MTLDGKVAYSHTHTEYVPTSNTHTIANVRYLQTTVDSKAVYPHTQTIANVTNLHAALDDKAAIS